MLPGFIVEDNPDIQLLLQTVASRDADYACVDVVGTGEEGLNKFFRKVSRRKPGKSG
jgi:hypothetical protein